MSKIIFKDSIKNIKARVTVPGSKSYTNRALILAALTKGSVTILHPLFSDDVDAMLSCLKTLGIRCIVKKDRIIVSGDISDVRDDTYTLNVRFSGTTIRFILALSVLVPGIKIIKGEKNLNARPIKVLVDGLRQLGADIEYLGEIGFPPLKVTYRPLTGNIVCLDGDVSSQYFSALLMIGPCMGGIRINVVGNQISKPYIDMTADTMLQFGVQVSNNHYRTYVVKSGQQYKKRSYTIEGDFSSAGYFFAIAVLTNSKITVKNLNPDSKQADIRFLKILERMGNKVFYEWDSVTITGSFLKSVTVNMEDCPDQAQTLAVLASFADGKSIIRGVRSLRIKETERVIALEKELKKMGIKTHSTLDTLTIYGGIPKPATINTYNDHRMAMSFAVAGVFLSGLTICDFEVVQKTFPQFWETLRFIGVNIQKKNL